MKDEAKKYRCQIVTGYEEPGPGGSWLKLEKSAPIIVAATSPNEARLMVTTQHCAKLLKGTETAEKAYAWP